MTRKTKSANTPKAGRPDELSNEDLIDHYNQTPYLKERFGSAEAYVASIRHPVTTYELSEGFVTKAETTTGEPPKWWKDEARLPTADPHDSQTVFEQWQAAVMADAVSDLTSHMEVVGAKRSTMDRIDALRNRFVYAMNRTQGESNATDFHDLLITILEGRNIGKGSDHKTDGGILAYYTCTKTTPNLKEDIEKLRRVVQALQNLAGDFKEHIPLETMTEELHVLAGDLKHYGFLDAVTAGRAETLSSMFSAVVSDLFRAKKPLTKDEAKAKSYLAQVHAVLREISEIGRSRRSQQPCEKLKEYGDDLERFAKQLDECPLIAQYRQFWEKLRQEDLKAIGGIKPPGNVDADKVIAADDQGKSPSRQSAEMSLPLGLNKWATIFGVSVNTIRIWRDDPKSKYHFDKKSERKWSLPLKELPVEYLEKYRERLS